MYDPDANAPPLNPIPWTVWLILLLVMGIEGVFQAGENGFIRDPNALGWRLAAAREFGFFDPLFDDLRETGRWFHPEMKRIATYPFIHRSFLEALMASVFILALGKFVGETLGALSVLAVFAGSVVLAAILYGIVLNDKILLLSAYTGAFGLIGAYTYILFSALQNAGDNALKAFRLIGFLMLIRLVFLVFFGGGLDWVAELFGFAFGFVLAIFLSPDAVARLNALRARIQRR